MDVHRLENRLLFIPHTHWKCLATVLSFIIQKVGVSSDISVQCDSRQRMRQCILLQRRKQVKETSCFCNEQWPKEMKTKIIHLLGGMKSNTLSWHCFGSLERYVQFSLSFHNMNGTDKFCRSQLNRGDRWSFMVVCVCPVLERDRDKDRERASNIPNRLWQSLSCTIDKNKTNSKWTENAKKSEQFETTNHKPR